MKIHENPWKTKKNDEKPNEKLAEMQVFEVSKWGLRLLRL